jgi:hypothetical protein
LLIESKENRFLLQNQLSIINYQLTFTVLFQTLCCYLTLRSLRLYLRVLGGSENCRSRKGRKGFCKAGEELNLSLNQVQNH